MSAVICISRRWFCLEDNTEQSESNPRLRPGIYKARRDGCLEDSTQLICSFALRLSAHALKRFTDNADATDFIFSRILFLLVLPVDIGFTTDCMCAYTALDYLQQEIIRDNHCAQQAPTNPARHNKNP